MPVDKFGRMSDTKTKDTGVSLTYFNNNYIRSDGISEITGNLNMASHTIENLGNPTNPKDAVTKEYADTKTNIIAVHTQYYGRLIKNRYQFTFGENVTYPPFSGFLIPHSGRIKKIVLRVEGYFGVYGSLFSLLLTKKEEASQTRLADCIFEIQRDMGIDEARMVYFHGDVRLESPFITKFYFDNDLENYPLSEGDLLNIRTEKDVGVGELTEEDPIPSFFFTFLIELDPL